MQLKTSPVDPADIRGAIRVAILSGQLRGGDSISLTELAARFKVDKLVVYRAVASLRQLGLLQSRRRAGTTICFPRIGVGEPEALRVVLLTAPVHHPWFPLFLEAFEQRAAESGVLVVLKNQSAENVHSAADHQQQAEFFHQLQESGVHDLVLWPLHGGADDNQLTRLRAIGWNLVVVDHFCDAGHSDCVGLDNWDAMTLLAGHIRSTGAKRVCYLGWTPASVPISSTTERAMAVRKAFDAASAIVVDSHAFNRNSPDWQHGVRTLLQGLMGTDTRPDAVVCVNKEVASAVLRAIEGQAAPPLVAVFDEVRPHGRGVVCVKQPVLDIARKAFECLLEQRASKAGWSARCVRLRGQLLTPAE